MTQYDFSMTQYDHRMNQYDMVGVKATTLLTDLIGGDYKRLMYKMGNGS